MSVETWNILWDVLQVLVLPLVAIVFVMQRRETQNQYISLREILTAQFAQREQAHLELNERVRGMERDLGEFKLSAAQNYLTRDDTSNIAGEMRDVKRKLDAMMDTVNRINVELTKEIHRHLAERSKHEPAK